MQNKKKAYIITGAWTAVFFILYLFLVTIAPKMSVFSNVKNLSTSYNEKIYLYNGAVVEQSFNMPYTRFSGIELGVGKEREQGGATVCVDILDPQGEIILSAKLDQLIFETGWNHFGSNRFVRVEEGAEYKMRIHVENATPDDIYLMTDTTITAYGQNVVNGRAQEGGLVASLWGTVDGAPGKAQFALFYMFFALLALVMIYTIQSKSIDFYFDSIQQIEKILLFALLFVSAVLVSTDFDLHMIIKGGYKVVDSIKEGQFHRFYDWAYESARASGNIAKDIYNYNILLFIFSAIITAPFMAISSINSPLLMVYFQLVITALVLYSVKLLKKVVMDFGVDKRFSDRVAILYLTSSITLYGTVGYGQVDIVYVIIMLFALRLYARKKYILFSLVMSLAVAFKFFPLLVFIPLVLLSRKKIKDIILCGAVCASIPGVFYLTYGRSAGYQAMSTAASMEYKFMERFTAASVGAERYAVYIVAALYILFCIYVFSKKIEGHNKPSMLMYVSLCGLVPYTLFMAFVLSNPQWVFPYAVFLSILIPFFKKTDILMYLSWVLNILYIVVYTQDRVPALEDANFGLLPFMGNHFYSGVGNIYYMMGSQRNTLVNFVSTAFAAVVIYIAIYMLRHADEEMVSYEKSHEPAKISRELLWARPGMLAVFYLFIFWCYYYVG